MCQAGTYSGDVMSLALAVEDDDGSEEGEEEDELVQDADVDEDEGEGAGESDGVEIDWMDADLRVADVDSNITCTPLSSTSVWLID
jgi:hypothetical protein